MGLSTDMQVFKLFVSKLDSRDLDTTLVDMSSVPSKYHEFCDVQQILCQHPPGSSNIQFKNQFGRYATPPFGPIYLLSPYELQTLGEFIDKHLANGLICPTCSPTGALVLFIKKKDGLSTTMC